MLCEVIGEPIKQSAELTGKPVKGQVKRALRRALARAERRPRAQVLLVMAEELGKFVPYVGGAAYAHTLLVPLEMLSTVEETVVREKAVESLNAVAAELPEAGVAEQYIPLVKARAGRPGGLGFRV